MYLVSLSVVCAVLLGLTLSSGRSFADPPIPVNGTYGELALATTIPNWRTLQKIVPLLTPSLQPDDPLIKSIRAAVGNVRNLVDIFVYAYPIVQIGKVTDVIVALINDVQTGWTYLGAYHDLKNVNYTEPTRRSRMNDVQNWLNRFKANTANLNYNFQLANVSKSEFFERPKDEVSYLYWGWSGLTPRKNDTGIQNIAVLLDGMWAVEQANFGTIMTLPDMWGNITQAFFFPRLPKNHSQRRLRDRSLPSDIRRRLHEEFGHC